MTAVQPKHFDENGKDVTEYMTIVPAAQYDATGRILATVRQAWPYTKARIDAGELFVKGEGQINLNTGQSDLYVDTSGATPVIKPRPTLTGGFDKTTMPVGQEAVFKALPACVVTFTGPATGSVKHPGGDFKIGFSTAGKYVLAFEPFPALPMQATLTVTLL